MIVKIGAIEDTPGANLKLHEELQKRTSGTGVGSSNAATIAVPLNDQIALSLATKFLQSANLGQDLRLERILELKTAILNEQYSCDPLLVSRALIEELLQSQ
ncbi:MAG TPA: hypothetical protein VKX49_28135 [Bryobacteraceae bacterium]|nr:hypothetical protein [Bryobacteraceae bacterium]